MSHVVEIDAHGALQLPADLLAALKPPARYIVELDGATLILHPAEPPLWATASPAERADAVRRWAALERPTTPVLADTALSRENIYD